MFIDFLAVISHPTVKYTSDLESICNREFIEARF